MESPTNKTKILIGDLVTTSIPIYSKLGDEFLFFRHQLMDDDFKLRPEWKQKTRRMQEEKADRTSIQRSRKLQDLIDGMIQDTHLAYIHSNISTTADRFDSLCAFAQQVPV
jgi:hypothetical protein